MAKVLVATKRCVEYAVRVRVRADRKGVETAGVKHSMNPFDEVGVEAAVVLLERKFAREVVAVTCGPAAARAVLRTALAMGATSAVHVVVPEEQYEGLEPIHVAQCLARVAEREGADLIITGKQAIDDDSNQTAQMTAGMLGWAQGTCCSGVEGRGGALEVTREVDGGVQRLRVGLPAVVSADLSLNRPRQATLPGVMRAGKVGVREVGVGELGVVVRPRVEVVSVEEAGGRRAGEVLRDVDELLLRLRGLGVIR